MEQRTEETFVKRVVETVFPLFTLYPRKFLPEIVFVHIEEALLLNEIAEHKAVEHNRSVPLLVLILLRLDIIIHAGNEIDEASVLLTKTCVKVFRYLLGVYDECSLHTLLYIHDGGVVIQSERQAIHLFIEKTCSLCIIVFHQHQVTLFN